MFKNLLLILSLLFSVSACAHNETFIRNRSIQLRSDRGSCSGEQVRTPSGHDYVLTAGHCRDILEDKTAVLITESGKRYKPHFVAEDTRSDLLLLRGIPGLHGLDIAKSLKGKEHVRTFTHGAAYSTYKTEGEMIESTEVTIPLFAVDTPEQDKACTGKPKLIRKQIVSIFGTLDVCFMSVKENVGTAMIVPGSSGGMVVNDSGELVGVVSAGNGSMPLFGYYVRLQDIQAFLKHR